MRLELGSVVRDDVLVRGDDRLAGTECGRDERPGRLVATHQFDDDVDLGRGHEMRRRVRQQVCRDPGRAGLRQVAARHADDLERRSVGRRQAVMAVQHPADDGATHGAGAQDSDAQRGVCGHREEW